MHGWVLVLEEILVCVSRNERVKKEVVDKQKIGFPRFLRKTQTAPTRDPDENVVQIQE